MSKASKTDKEKMMTDQELIDLCSADKERGFAQLMRAFREPIYWHIRRMVVSHSDAEDVFQEVWVNVYRYIGRFEGASSLKTWLYRIATNEALRFIDKAAAHRHESESELLLGKLEASEYVDFDNEVLIRLQKAIIGLPDKQRLVLNMRYYDDLSYEEISAITGSSVQTLKTNYHYAKEKIKDCILNG